MKKLVLGRGLETLLPKSRASQSDPLKAIVHPVAARAHEAAVSDETSREVAIGAISPNPKQPRRSFNDQSLEELATSIKLHGVIQPLVVREVGGGKYELIAGERRWHAARKAGLTRVPVVIRKSQTDESFMIALIENLQREDLNPIEEGLAYKRLYEEFDISHDEIAKRVGKSRSTVTNTIRLLSLPEKIVESLKRGEVSQGQVRPLLMLDRSEAEKLFDIIITQSLTVRDIENLVSKIKESDGEAKHPKKAKITATDTVQIVSNDIMDKMMRRLGRKIQFIGSGTKGQIRIDYYSKDDLIHLVDWFLGEKR